jgi:hypothetical protein
LASSIACGQSAVQLCCEFQSRPHRIEAGFE